MTSVVAVGQRTSVRRTRGHHLRADVDDSIRAVNGEAGYPATMPAYSGSGMPALGPM